MGNHLNSLYKRVSNLIPEQFDWGQITWLIRGITDPGAQQTVGLCHINPGASNPLHYHPNCEEVLYVISGSCIKLVGDKSFAMKTGDVVRIPKGQNHRATANSNEPFICLITYDVPNRQIELV